jgi:hypothetical protein
MYLKKFLPAIFILFFITNCFSQETIEKKNRLTDEVTERFHVLKNNEQIKEGLYQALFKRKLAVASGKYTQGKKTGVWYFYNNKGTVVQIYNYDKDSLRYESREDTTSSLRYLIDKVISDTDKVTKPIKVGGRYYGYLPYLGLYKIPFNPYEYGTFDLAAVVELLISPLGRLAEYKVHLFSPYNNYNPITTMDIRLFKEEDRKFIPATYNGKPVLSRIIISCRVTIDGGLDFLR